MVYAQALIDNFNGAALDTSKWTETQGPGVSLSGGSLKMACVEYYPRIEGKNLFDLTTGIFAAKLTVEGTRVPACEVYLGAQDLSGNYVAVLGSPSSSYLAFQPGGLATTSSEVITDATGLSTGWVDGTWWGIGNAGLDNSVGMYKSSDGQNWTEMGRCVIGGAFNKNNVVMTFMSGVWDGSSSLVASYDDASFWAPQAETFVTRKVRWGGNWIPATPRVRSGGAWVAAAPRPNIYGDWDPMTD